MAMSGDRGAYADCYELFDQALEKERGLQILCISEDKAKELQLRFNYARRLDRELNRAIYASDPNHPKYNRSEYAALMFRVVFDHDRGIWLLKLQKLALLSDMEIEDIPAPEEEIEDLDDVG